MIISQNTIIFGFNKGAKEMSLRLRGEAAVEHDLVLEFDANASTVTTTFFC